jgi:hypothetical protein
LNLGDHVMNYAEHRKRQHLHRVQLWNSLTSDQQAAAIADRERWLWKNLFTVIAVKHVEHCESHARVRAWPTGIHCAACELVLIFDRWIPDGRERFFTKAYQFDTKWAVRVGTDSVEHWNRDDWNMLQEMNSLDVEYFAWSSVFMEWLADNGTEEQTAKFLECRSVPPPTNDWLTAHA